jgi:cellulose synthase/poly-beta-1,6-N-acetylglucosamine synthase-like glycosyltransferase
MEFITLIIYTSIYIGLIATTFYILSFVGDNKRKKPLFSDTELPSVSVIIPAFNEERTIENTIKSILAADYPVKKFEIIVIDDGSKDSTYQIAKKFESKKNPVLSVFTKENGGKGTALNFGIKKAKGEFIFTMDADTYVNPESMKNMIRFFKDERVNAVTPAMIVKKPETIWQRIQYIEYILGLFLRKAFASVDAIYITPGAFSAYRKSFFDKYGGYDVGNITEDLEMSLRIQYNGYKIENCPEAIVYTSVPKTFKSLLIQRRRWYFGLIKNTMKYKQMLTSKYGDLGVFVMPIAWISIFFAVFITSYLFVKTLFDVKKQILFLSNINFNLSGIVNLNFFMIERTLFLFFSNPVVLFIIVFMVLLGFYMYYASKKIGRISGLIINVSLFFLFFAVLFGFWWIVSIFYTIFYEKIEWR